MKERQRLQLLIADNTSKINDLRKENRELHIQALMLCDDEQWYKEENETRGIGKRKETNLIGRIYWKEDFTDQGNPSNIITIERSRVVKVNGEWHI